jgi:glycosyltransferase involved in cell wall biosynthesis
MKKILFLATYPNQTNGYAKIGNKITNYLADYYDVYYFGFSNYKDVYVPREVHKDIKIIDVVEEEKKLNLSDSFGVDIIENWVKSINPDIIILYNDIIVTCRHLNILNKLRYEQGINFKFISYLDLVYDYERFDYINFVNQHSDKILVFSEHWKENLISMEIPEEKIDIIPHGLDESIFFKLDKIECRKELGLNIDDFIILNANRNSYRKAIDITISSFLKFLKMNEKNPKINNIKLFLHCEMSVKSGYDIFEIVKIECIKEGLDFEKIKNNHILRFQNNKVSDDVINKLYNACDMGINTCIGEGFGLCNFEQITLSKPQLVSYVGAYKDIFRDYPEFTILPVSEYNITPHIDDHCGTVYLCRAKDFADKINIIYNYYKKYEIIADKCGKKIKNKYIWKDILNKIKNSLEELY